jgi:hypothetical protein
MSRGCSLPPSQNKYIDTLCSVTSLQLLCSNAPNCFSTLLQLEGPRFVNVQSLSVLTETGCCFFQNFSFTVFSLMRC